MNISVSITDVVDSMSIEEMIEVKKQINNWLEFCESIYKQWSPKGYLKIDYINYVVFHSTYNAKWIEQAYDLYQLKEAITA